MATEIKEVEYDEVTVQTKEKVKQPKKTIGERIDGGVEIVKRNWKKIVLGAVAIGATAAGGKKLLSKRRENDIPAVEYKTVEEVSFDHMEPEIPFDTSVSVAAE